MLLLFYEKCRIYITLQSTVHSSRPFLTHRLIVTVATTSAADGSVLAWWGLITIPKIQLTHHPLHTDTHTHTCTPPPMKNNHTLPDDTCHHILIPNLSQLFHTPISAWRAQKPRQELNRWLYQPRRTLRRWAIMSVEMCFRLYLMQAVNCAHDYFYTHVHKIVLAHATVVFAWWRN